MVTMVEKDKSIFSLEQVTENAPEDLKIPGLWEGKVRLPTIKEKLSVREEIKKLPFYDSLTDDEKKLEESKLLAMKMIVEPRMTLSEYLDCPDGKINIILDTVSFWYATKLKILNDKRKDLIDYFLEVMNPQIEGKKK
uniref:Uncharacterized protein n=1 Tax=viral metagenome TaxID=1070528 RepID=A0A6H1ZKX7_9ZZZZ